MHGAERQRGEISPPAGAAAASSSSGSRGVLIPAVSHAGPDSRRALAIRARWKGGRRGDLLALRRRPARERDLLPLLRTPNRHARSRAARGADRRPARGASTTSGSGRRSSSSGVMLVLLVAGIVARRHGIAGRGRDLDRPRSLPAPHLSGRCAPLARNAARARRCKHGRPCPRRSRRRRRVDLDLVEGWSGRGPATEGAVSAPPRAGRQDPRARCLGLRGGRTRRRAEGFGEGARDRRLRNEREQQRAIARCASRTRKRRAAVVATEIIQPEQENEKKS